MSESVETDPREGEAAKMYLQNLKGSSDLELLSVPDRESTEKAIDEILASDNLEEAINFAENTKGIIERKKSKPTT